jgi:nitroreductase
MQLEDAIGLRASAARLTEPGPSREQLNVILNAATRAPDHGRLSPWRFIIVVGDGRRTLGEAMAAALRERDPEAKEAALDVARGKPMRAPTIVAVAAAVRNHAKVPEIEQVLAVGAAVQNMLLTAFSLGIGAMWKTGAAAYSTHVKKALGLAPGDHIVALLYLGTPVATGAARPADADKYTRWL